MSGMLTLLLVVVLRVKVKKCGLSRCLGVMHTSRQWFLCVCPSMAPRRVGARSEPRQSGCVFVVSSVWARLLTSDSSGSIIKATLGSTSVGIRQ